MKTKIMKKIIIIAVLFLISFGQVLRPFDSFADYSSTVDEIAIRVPISCTMGGTGTHSHNAEIRNGQYNSAIGETTLQSFCNDKNGFVIYAIGYTDNIDGKNVLANSAQVSSQDIVTGTATGTVGGVDKSQWAMRLSVVTDPEPTYPITVQNGFDSFHKVPDEYTAVAKHTSNTDIGTSAEGSTLKTTYQVYISNTQLAGTYVGQVKYLLLHPHLTPVPYNTMLDTGPAVAAKMKTLAASATKDYSDETSDIKAVRMANSIPYGFVATNANTVSTPDSKHPIYIFFDNTNDAGIMYFYSGKYQIVMNNDSSYLFGGNLALSDVSGLENWDSSNVNNMTSMFSRTAITDTDSFMNWDVSSVNNMSYMFQGTHLLNNISGIANWDVTGVTAAIGSSSVDTNNFYGMFGDSAVSPRLFVSRPGSWNSFGTYIPSY